VRARGRAALLAWARGHAALLAWARGHAALLAWARGHAALLAGCGILAACAATRPPAPDAPAPDDASCAALAAVPPVEAACARDGAIRSLRARFRADVEAGGETRSADGVLAWQAPGSLRVKLFGLAGLTVYDAVWSGDATLVRGVVRQPLRDRTDVLALGPDEVPPGADADLSLVLWSLWQPRCATPPEPSVGARVALDASSGRASAREVDVGGGLVREEVLVRHAASGAGAAATERVVARYAAYECGTAPPLPRRIEIEAPASGWRARVTIVEQARDPVLDPELFAIPPAGAG